MIIVRLFRSLVLCLFTFNPLSVSKSITMHVWHTEESKDGEGGHTHGVSTSSLEILENASSGACSYPSGIEVFTQSLQVTYSPGHESVGTYTAESVYKRDTVMCKGSTSVTD